jgi:hypothetical protein
LRQLAADPVELRAAFLASAHEAQARAKRVLLAWGAKTTFSVGVGGASVSTGGGVLGLRLKEAGKANQLASAIGRFGERLSLLSRIAGSEVAANIGGVGRLVGRQAERLLQDGIDLTQAVVILGHSKMTEARHGLKPTERNPFWQDQHRFTAAALQAGVSSNSHGKPDLYEALAFARLNTQLGDDGWKAMTQLRDTLTANGFTDVRVLDHERWDVFAVYCTPQPTEEQMKGLLSSAGANGVEWKLAC